MISLDENRQNLWTKKVKVETTMLIKNISRKKIIIAVSVFLFGILCGALNCMEGGTWAMRMGKGNDLLGALIGGLVSLFSMFGNLTFRLGHKVIGGNHFNPWLFWPGQLVFYSFVSISILKLRKRTTKRS